MNNRGWNLKTHGLSAHRLNSVWRQQKYRCNNPNAKHYEHYGGRGIKFSKEFYDFEVWLNYVMSLDNAMKATYSIDRINNDEGYTRGNLAWVTKSHQQKNRRAFSSTGIKNIYYDKERDKYKVQLWDEKNKKHIALGRFKTLDEAKSILKNKLEGK